MVTTSSQMVRDALDAFVNFDADAARNVCEADAAVDQQQTEVIDELCGMMKSNTHEIEPALYCFSAARHLERIADHATNIAEDVIYLVEGEIVRHNHPEQDASATADASANGTLE